MSKGKDNRNSSDSDELCTLRKSRSGIATKANTQHRSNSVQYLWRASVVLALNVSKQLTITRNIRDSAEK